MGRVEGKVAIITGAAKGLGEADARLLVQEGAKVVLTDTDVKKGSELADELGAENALFLEHDVSNEERWKEVLKNTEDNFGSLNILVNNAGIVIPGTIESQKTADYRFIMSVHVDGTFFGCKYCIPYMERSGSGSIINMASIASHQGERYVAAYCAAKAAIEGLTRATAVHCKQEKKDIRCNAIAPSGITTPMTESFPQQMEDEGLADLVIPMEATPSGEPNDIAYMVLYLASDESKFVSGTRMCVDNSMSVTSGTVPG